MIIIWGYSLPRTRCVPPKGHDYGAYFLLYAYGLLVLAWHTQVLYRMSSKETIHRWESAFQLHAALKRASVLQGFKCSQLTIRW